MDNSGNFSENDMSYPSLCAVLAVLSAVRIPTTIGTHIRYQSLQYALSYFFGRQLSQLPGNIRDLEQQRIRPCGLANPTSLRLISAAI
jgi:L-fucose isomerase-like protein